ncbi:MAG: hypothetical protein E7Z91_02585 [Cyanobacteria bacterium SIG30]|nr:hypothetical protein [Cyanobacteria bacterium SIG30]
MSFLPLSMNVGYKLGKQIGDVWANETPVGRMATKDEDFCEAIPNAYNAKIDRYYEIYSNNNAIGRMETKGEDFFEAYGNAIDENIKDWGKWLS